MAASMSLASLDNPEIPRYPDFLFKISVNHTAKHRTAKSRFSAYFLKGFSEKG
jgi:hypothetical protein